MARVQKQWTAQEISPIYWLVIYGVDGAEIATILTCSVLAHRTWEAVRGEIVEVRKFIAMAKHQILKRPLSERSLKLMREATKIQPLPDILAYKKEEVVEIAPIRGHRDHLNIDFIPNEKKTELETPIIALPTQEPTVLDVMKLAKELGAKEVEYKDMKITY